METTLTEPKQAQNLRDRLHDRTARIGVIGLGYVGLPLAMGFGQAGFHVTGFDTDPEKVIMLNEGQPYIQHLGDKELKANLAAGKFRATGDSAELAEMDAILVCVPTPLDHHRSPDMTYVIRSMEAVAETLRTGQLVILESTTYPGTTDELVRLILERSGLTCDEDFFLAYSPEREDPGNKDFNLQSVPKVVGGIGPASLDLAVLLYQSIVSQVVQVTDTRTAEAVKLTENIFRAVNIALVNELKLIYGHMDVDIWNVIEAAKTKPYGYMPFYPGPGLGGHCIPIDPFYLSWKAREYETSARFIELAGEINSNMPRHVVNTLIDALGTRVNKPVHGARILIMGVAYKKNVGDIRESPALKILSLLQERGAILDYYDPHVPMIPETREYKAFAGWRSIDLDKSDISDYDAVMICTDHDSFPYQKLVDKAQVIVDTRNCFSEFNDAAKVIKS